ncbi:MAG: endonuclease/exonuclease/phosphatase family protein [Saprospiraceae bacterium]|jgi:endonuclease/exonuclease/phosphatase family metal-dependent hydrolase|nr:endonuclease/exonuclease/phosphatase family protein [Saprospiraceae bacterium]MCO5279230.1 endonuclease/exonuclease/phosphatase family protein [Saprospiraceae bacterium]TXH53120.1 MAG: endonuclease/exonuclease/phosphatase family protein [Bacteroidia bacterium]
MKLYLVLFFLFICNSFQLLGLTNPGGSCLGIKSEMIKDSIKITSFNIRLASANDGINRWQNRKELLKQYILKKKPDILGVQEAELVQMAFIDSLEGYDYVGVGRDNGMSQGEFSAIFYNSDKYEVKESGTFWLSSTPNKPTMGWDAVCYRICTWARFSGKDHKEFYVLNTHFDHIGKTARIESARLIMSKINLLNPSLPIFLMGDFNTESESLPIRVIQDFMADSRAIAEIPDDTDGMTFNNFSESVPASIKIDFIFVNNMIRVLSFKTNKEKPEGRFISDHYPVEGVFVY